MFCLGGLCSPVTVHEQKNMGYTDSQEAHTGGTTQWGTTGKIIKGTCYKKICPAPFTNDFFQGQGEEKIFCGGSNVG